MCRLIGKGIGRQIVVMLFVLTKLRILLRIGKYVRGMSFCMQSQVAITKCVNLFEGFDFWRRKRAQKLVRAL